MNSEKEELPKQTETIDELMAKISQLEKEKEQYLDNLKRAKNDVLRLQSEYEEKLKQIKEIANFELVYYLLNILDNFELAFNEVKDDAVSKGFYLIYSQLKDILNKFGVFEITEMKKFDPNLHEAILTEKCSKPQCDKSDDGLIVEVFSKGYVYNNKIIRPARVKVLSHN
ncbi:MAG: protein GrpE [Candidatus Parcubacteria bacterium]|nr:MAG: protein GrpE [Candidatus Parcubacteria bacterium]